MACGHVGDVPEHFVVFHPHGFDIRGFRVIGDRDGLGTPLLSKWLGGHHRALSVFMEA